MNLRCITVAVGLCFASLSVVLGDEADNGNLITNPSFEEGDKLPLSWKASAYGSCVTHAWDNEFFRGGERSLFLCNEDREGWGAWITSCAVKGGTTYRLSVWVKVQPGRGRIAITLVRARGPAPNLPDGKRVWEDTSKKIGDTGDRWELLEWEFTTPPGMEQMQIWLWNINGEGQKVWFEDLTMKEKL